MNFKIIDIHTHPFIAPENNICGYKSNLNMGVENTYELCKHFNVTKICGSVIQLGNPFENNWEKVKHNNNIALELKEIYKDFYIPGFHVHPDYIQESIDEIKRMKKEGINLIGELVPYCDGWDNYSSEEFYVLLDETGKNNMIVSIHSQGEDEMDEMVKKHKDVIFIAAHPGEYTSFMRHIERAKMSENYYIDLSGYGVFRHGMLRYAIDYIGVDRILFGSDFPTCSLSMYVGAVLLDNLITDTEKEKIFSLNAKKLLNLK